MRKLITIAVGLALLWPSMASADWRWAPPHFQSEMYICGNNACVRKEHRRYRLKVRRYNQRRLKEWRHWTHLYIPSCTWYGESGTGPQFARIRYVTPNAGGSGAYGKYQMMPRTYHSDAKYHDWSPLDQEIAGHREYWKHGTSPWTNC